MNNQEAVCIDSKPPMHDAEDLSSLPRHLEISRFNRSDSGNAELFAALFGSIVRYDHAARRWLVWNRHWWTPDDTQEVAVLAKELARWRSRAAFSLEDADKRTSELKWAMKSESRHRLEATIKLAQPEPPIADDGKHWDANPMLLGVANGVIDLKTGELRPGKQSDRVTLHTDVAFDPKAKCPRFEQFLTEVFGSDQQLIEYVQKAVGYSLTGDVREQVFFLAYGTGANGKSTFLEVVRTISGAYAYNLPFSAFELKGRSAIPNEIAALSGKRFVTAVETNESAELNEGRLKALTGSDLITARFLYRELFTFDPTAKFWLAFNHKPKVSDDSPGFWRRVRLIPFLKRFTADQADPNLLDTLRGEASGILNWAVEGTRKWEKEGLQSPALVGEASEEYREESDVLKEFLEDGCVVDPSGQIPAATLWKGYVHWADSNHERSVDRKTFSQKMQMRGFKKVRMGHERTWTWLGVSLRRNAPSTDPLPSSPSLRADADVKMPLLDHNKEIEQRM
jgi:putative DNA primase/helicase